MNISDIYKQQNLVIQELDYSCGAVSLLNILHLKNDFSRTEQELADICNARKNIGTSHEDLIAAAKVVGLEVVGCKQSAVLGDIEWNIDEGNYVIVNYTDAFSGDGHYAVVTEYDDKALYLRDSVYGLARFEKATFEKHWISGDGIPQWYMAVR